MNSSLTRPKFDAAVDTCQLPAEYHEPLWKSLRLALTGKLPIDRHLPRPSWSDDAIALREPLRREIEACRKRAAESTVFGRGDKREITFPNGSKRLAANIFAAYRQSIAEIQARMDTALREGGHWRNGPVDGVNSAPEPQPIAVICANEQAAGRHAGLRDWVQWEAPGVRSKLTAMIEEANKQQYSGRRWHPYTVPLSSISERGVALLTQRAAVWRKAFHKLLTATIEERQRIADIEDPDTPHPSGYPVLEFWEALRDEPVYQAAIFEACDDQARSHRTPANARFAYPNSIWHALPFQMRLDLSSRLDALDRDIAEANLARGLPLADPMYNPFALTEDENAQLSAG